MRAFSTQACRHFMANRNYHVSVVTIHHMREDRWIFSFASEILVLSILFVLYLVGAAIATVCHKQQFGLNADGPLVDMGRFIFLPPIPSLPNPHRHGRIRVDVVDCSAWFIECVCIRSVPQITDDVSLVASVFAAIANAAFFSPFHGRWNPRESTYSDRRTSVGNA